MFISYQGALHPRFTFILDSLFLRLLAWSSQQCPISKTKPLPQQSSRSVAELPKCTFNKLTKKSHQVSPDFKTRNPLANKMHYSRRSGCVPRLQQPLLPQFT